MRTEKNQKKRIMKFITYYRGLKTKQKGDLKALIITECDISGSAFHYKMENLNYSKLEIDAIEKVIEKFKEIEKEKEDGIKES